MRFENHIYYVNTSGVIELMVITLYHKRDSYHCLSMPTYGDSYGFITMLSKASVLAECNKSSNKVSHYKARI